ncbi:hypothetical protein JI435_439270 [Parastagonospora nodorum SN15]|uniref:Uncharacterized protein n=1 Tax=Phaeosphaeria nodorum (strain SN15 / ATCC MYA-4574 / FGSC 10173) TaxID=321614 RepID=A0A7U2I2W8_PHANO|nr:hypothetical protein HBH53_110650 [Parastagonospora nodorum]QRD01326.1 hypothetical protein JI435_439270 [Parastagonospora nodorum SN15]KAH3997770.1 hypothetical protein HBI10_135610 [Parastagonospora nodorum]KAH4020593.1 hypothetical protein HBI13_116860 [Parastagonospora nodorum]KAH4119377.1 hypothetical protein HBH47_129630 [Parastagonospora nodorum]
MLRLATLAVNSKGMSYIGIHYDDIASSDSKGQSAFCNQDATSEASRLGPHLIRFME